MLHIEPRRIEAGAARQVAGKAARAHAATHGADFSALVAERRPIRTSGARLASPIEGLLALQGGEDGISPAIRRRAAKGMALLDTLDELRLDALSGRPSTATLDTLAGQLRDLGPSSRSKGLERVMQALELRVRVELAKCEAQREANSQALRGAAVESASR